MKPKAKLWKKTDQGRTLKHKKHRFAVGACGKAKILLAGALDNTGNCILAAALLLVIGAAVQFAGIELFQPVFAEMSVTQVLDQASHSYQQAPSGNSYYRSMSESMSVVASHGGGANSPTSHLRSMSESMSVTSIQGKAPNSYSRSMSEQASLTTGMPPSAPAGSQLRAAPAPATPYSTSSNQRIDERLSPTLKMLGKRGDTTVKNSIGGTPILATEFLGLMQVGSPDQFSETGEISDDASPDDSSALLRQLDAVNEYMMMQKSLGNAALANLSTSVALLLGAAVVVVARQPAVSSGRLQKKMYAIFLLRREAGRDEDGTTQKTGNKQVTYVLLLALVIFTVSSIVNAVDPLAGQAFAAITPVGVGIAASDAPSGSGTLVPSLPSGLQVDDLMVVYYYSRTDTGSVSISAGWTPLYDDMGTSGHIAAWYRLYQAGDTDPTITVSGLETGNPASRDDIIAQIAAWRGVDTNDPVDALGIVNTNASQQNIGAISGITVAADSVVIVLGGKLDDWTSVATLTGDSLTWTEIGEPDSTGGADAGMVWDYAINGATQKTIISKTFTVTGGASAAGKGVMFSLNVKPPILINLSDTMGMTDSIIAKVTLRAVADSLSTADTISINVNRQVTDSIAIADTVARSLTQSRATTEQMTTTDSIAISTTKQVSEQLGMTESPVRSIILSKMMTEQMTIQDTLSTVVTKALSEQFAMTDVLARNTIVSRSLIEQMTMTDTVAKTTLHALAEQLGIQDTISSSSILSRFVSEQLSVQDTVAKLASMVITEQLTITDSSAKTVMLARSVSEQLGMTETMTKTISMTLIEQLALTETVAKTAAFARSILEQLTTAGAISKAIRRTMAEQLTIQDTLARLATLSRTAAEQLAVQDPISKAVSKTMAEQTAMTDQAARTLTLSVSTSEQLDVLDAIVVSIAKSVSESLSMTDAAARLATQSRSMTEQLAMQEMVSIVTARAISEQLGATDAITGTLTVSRTVTEQLTITDAVSAASSRSLTEQLGIVDSIEKSIIITSLREQMTLTDIIRKDISKSMIEQLAATESAARSVANSRSLSEQLAAQETISRSVSAVASSLEQLAVTEVLTKALSKSVSESLGMTDSLARSLAQTGSMSEQLTLAESVTASITRSIAEQLGAAESVSRSVLLSRAMSEQLVITDVAEAQVSKAMAEQLAIQDTVSVSTMAFRPAVESMSLTESVAASQAKEMQEQLVVSDSITAISTGTVFVTDQIDITESIAIAVTKSVSDQLAIIESAIPTSAIEASDQLGMSESITVSMAISIADDLALSDSITATAAGGAFAADQLGMTESIAISVSKQVSDLLALTDAAMVSPSTNMADSASLTDMIVTSIAIARAVSDSLALSDTTSGAPVVLVIITDSMSIDDSFADIALLIHLDLGEPLVLVQSFATNFTGFFNQVDSEGIIIGDSVVLSLVPSGQVLNRDIIEVMEIEDSIIMLVMIPPPPPPPAITTMPDLMMTETEDLDEFDGLTDPAEAVEVDGVWNVDSLDEQGLQSLLDAIGMPVYDVDLEAISDEIGDMTMIVPAFKVSMNISGQTSDDGMFLTPTLSNLPAGLQVIIPIDVQASMNGAGNLDHLGSVIVTFTAAESTDDFAMLITLLDNNPEGTADELPNDTPAFYIDISIVGNFTGTTPSDEAFFEEPPQITFTITEEWAQEQSVERDSNNVPIIGLLLLDEGSGEWIELSDEVEPPASAVDGIYTYTATVPHFSTYAVTASASDDSNRGSNRDRTFTRLLSESLFVSGVANLDIPAGSGGKIVIKDITESLTLRIVQPQPLHERVITINDITVAVSIVDVRSAATLGTAVATLNFEFINKGITSEELVLRFWYPDPAGGDIVYEAEQTITAGAGESIVEEVKIPFSSPGLYDVMIEVESEDGILSTTDIVVDVPWLTVYLYILIVIAIIVVLASIAYVIYAMRRSGLFIIGGK